MNAVCFQLFGRFMATDSGNPIAGLEARKVQELLGFLLVNRRQPHTRERLIDLLWPDKTPAQGKKYLRQTLWQLQSALDNQGDHRFFLVETDWVEVDSMAPFRLDIADFELICACVNGVRGRALTDEQVTLVEQALTLYKGPLLDGWYDDWFLFERERLANLHLTLLDKMMGYAEVHELYETGIIYGTQILRHDLARERTHRRLMRLRYRQGDRTGALRQFDQCRTILADELGVEPSARTMLLYTQIRDDAAEPRAADDTLLLYLQQLRHNLKQTDSALEQLIRQLRGG